MHRKIKSLITLGVLTALVPFLGVPSSWKDALTVIFGVGTLIVATMLYRGSKKRSGSSFTTTNVNQNMEDLHVVNVTEENEKR